MSTSVDWAALGVAVGGAVVVEKEDSEGREGRELFDDCVCVNLTSSH